MPVGGAGRRGNDAPQSKNTILSRAGSPTPAAAVRQGILGHRGVLRCQHVDCARLVRVSDEGGEMKTDQQIIAELRARIRVLEKALLALEGDYEKLKEGVAR